MEGLCKLCFSHFIGAVDGAHIQISPAKGQVAEYINRKQTTSVLLQGTMDHTGRFPDIEVSYSGRNHVSKQSVLCIATNASVFVPFNPTITGWCSIPHLWVAHEALRWAWRSAENALWSLPFSHTEHGGWWGRHQTGWCCLHGGPLTWSRGEK